MTTPDVHVGPISLAVASYLRQLRRARGISQQRLADLVAAATPDAKLPRATISSIEAGHRRITVDDLHVIAAALGISMHELITPGACANCGGQPAAGFACLTCGAGGGAGA